MLGLCLILHEIAIANKNVLKALFEATDTNGDGVVPLEEFTAYHVEFFSTTENKLNSAILYGPLD